LGARSYEGRFQEQRREGCPREMSLRRPGIASRVKPYAAVDTFGRVHGTGRLSVIGASIVPNGPSAFTHISAVMIAERLSEQTAPAI
jgi:choline dehydrogenase-like flavoprotein